MGINSTEVAYGFGQMGSALITGTAAVTSNSVDGMRKAVFCAITFLEDTVFDSAGLIAEDRAMYTNSDTGSTGISSANTATTDDVSFAAGITIYGRWTSIMLDSGKVVAYIGY